jgi:hypothetical protein
MKIEFVYSFFACTNLDVDFHFRHLRLWGLPWTRYSRRSLAHPLQSTMFKNLDRTPFAYSLFCLKIDLLKLEVMRMLSKHHSIQRDQLEMITYAPHSSFNKNPNKKSPSRLRWPFVMLFQHTRLTIKSHILMLVDS